MVRSIPEKTLEHWASIYAEYRYRSFAGLWWPTRDEDITVGRLPTRGPGKVFNLEIKTTEAIGAHRHRARIDVAQLRRYVSLRVPTYYVFPVPVWSGPIHDTGAAPWLASTPRSELGFTRTGPQWFGRWTVVILHDDLFAHVRATTAADETVFTVDVSGSGPRVVMGRRFAGVTAPLTAPSAGVATPFLRWREFWDDMDACGGPRHLPAVFAVPGGGGAGEMSRSELVITIEAAAGRTSTEELVFYVPAGRDRQSAADQAYVRVLEDEPAVLAPPRERRDDVVESHLTSVFVSAKRIADVRGR